MLFARGRVAERSLYFCQNVWYTKGVTIKRYIFERGINMPKSLGKTIRRLRIERGYTQEDLARLLSVSPQTVSKWENETNMPDISLIVPLANVLSVTTDTLFGLEPSADEAVRNAHTHADALWKSGDHIGAYRYLCNELKLRPNCPPLLLMCLQYGGWLAIADPENDTYDPDHATAIYRECIRMANTFFEHAKDVDGILWAHVIMSSLHASHGRFDQAEEHARLFPQRADLTIHWMLANVARFKNDSVAIASNLQTDFSFKFQSVLDSTVELASALFELGKYDGALNVCKFSLKFIEQAFDGAPVVLRFWERDLGNFYAIAAKSHLALNDKASALDCLEEFVRREYALEELKEAPRFESALFGDEIKLYCRLDMFYAMTRREQLVKSLSDPAFSPIRNDPRFSELLTSLG